MSMRSADKQVVATFLVDDVIYVQLAHRKCVELYHVFLKILFILKLYKTGMSNDKVKRISMCTWYWKRRHKDFHVYLEKKARQNARIMILHSLLDMLCLTASANITSDIYPVLQVLPLQKCSPPFCGRVLPFQHDDSRHHL